MTKLVHAERVTGAIVVKTEPGQPNTGSMSFCYIFVLYNNVTVVFTHRFT